MTPGNHMHYEFKLVRTTWLAWNGQSHRPSPALPVNAGFSRHHQFSDVDPQGPEVMVCEGCGPGHTHITGRIGA